MKDLDKPHILKGMTATMRYAVRYGVFLAVGLLLGLAIQNSQTYSDDMQSYFRQSVWQVKSSSGSGTGFFISPTLLVTNHHVVNPRDDNVIQVRNHNRALLFTAMVVKEDEMSDLALLFCECGGYLPMTLPLGQFPDQGVELYSAGYGLSKHLAFAFGHAQGVQRDMPPGFPADHFASVTTIMGDSGSPVLNKQMEIVGVRNAVESYPVFYSLPQKGIGPYANEVQRYIRMPAVSHSVVISARTLQRFLDENEDDFRGK